MIQPARAWPRLAALRAEPGAWLWLRRPLLIAAVFGCMVSLMTSGRLTLRLAVPAALYCSFVPLCEIVALAAVPGRRKLPLAQAIDLFFIGQAPWMLWLTYFAAVWAFASPVHVFGWASRPWAFDRCAMLAAAWSLYIDFWFFRCVFGHSPVAVIRDLLVQRTISWTAGLAIFLSSAGVQVLATRLGL
jgi:hypothetical protein